MKIFFGKIAGAILLAACFLQKVSAEDTTLGRADSLFANKKYTEAFQLYDQIFREGNASSAMLVKMAFIKEGLGNYADALYYLNLYYSQTSDKEALAKMRAIAEEQKLMGYEYSDTQYFLNYLMKYKTGIILCLLAIMIFLSVYAFRNRANRPVGTFIFQFLISGVIAVLINGWFYKESAIISQDNVLLMSGPSAGAEPVDYIGKGHRVELLKEGQVWCQIRWEGKSVFVRNKNLKVL